MVPDQYARYCGPGAVAAVTGSPRDVAAKSLAWWKRRAGWSAGTGTSPNVLATALLMRGYQLERWCVYRRCGWRIETADEFGRRIWGAIRNDRERIERIYDLALDDWDQHQTLAPPVQRRVRAALRVRHGRRRARRPSSYTVGEWRTRRAIGTWILHVDEHLVVVRDGAIIAGDRGQHDEDQEPLLDAWRVLPRLI